MTSSSSLNPLFRNESQTHTHTHTWPLWTHKRQSQTDGPSVGQKRRNYSVASALCTFLKKSKVIFISLFFFSIQIIHDVFCQLIQFWDVETRGRSVSKKAGRRVFGLASSSVKPHYVNQSLPSWWSHTSREHGMSYMDKSFIRLFPWTSNNPECKWCRYWSSLLTPPADSTLHSNMI